jgi:hypothetical protein
MKIKVSEATQLQLAWLVAKCEGATDKWHTCKPFFWDGVPFVREAGHDVEYTPSTDWAQGGPIIEREGIDLSRAGSGWWALSAPSIIQSGPTPLVAAMRCYVASKLGDEVDVPEELK